MKAKLFTRIVAAMLALTLVAGLAACDPAGDYRITVEGGAYGTVTTVAKADAGELVTVNVDAKSGYEVHRVYVNGTAIEGNTFLMPADDVTVSVTYTADSDEGAYTVTVVDDIYGSTYASLATANEGDTVTLTTATSYATKLKHYLVNGERVTGNSFLMPAKDVTVTAEYESLIPETPVSFECVASFQRARSYWYASYEPEGIRIRAVVDDNITFASDIVDPNMGYKDNIEFTVGFGAASDLSPRHFNVLVSCDGNHWFRQFQNGWVGADETGVIFDCEPCNIMDHGFNGYIATVTIPYSKFGVSMAAAVGNMTLGVSMRNTTNRLKTAWSSFTGMGHAWGNGRKHLVITEDGTLVPNVSPADYVLVGDQVLHGIAGDYAAFGSFANEIDPEKSIDEWVADVDRIAMYDPKELTFTCGTNDLTKKTVMSTFASLQEFVTAIRMKLPRTKLVFVSAIPMISSNFDLNKTLAFNAMVKDYAEEIGMTYLDLCGELVKDGVIDQSMYNEPSVLFDTGMAVLRKLFLTHYGRFVEANADKEWGDVGQYIAIGSWNVSSSTMTASNGGTSFIYFKGLDGTKDFDFTVEMGADVIHNADPYPKFGIHLNNINMSRYYFVYADGLTKSIAGEVDRNHKNYDWTNASEINVAGLQYAGGTNYATLKISKRGANVTYTCNGVTISSGADAIGSEPVTLGLFAYNLSIRVRNWSLITYDQGEGV